MKSKSLEGIKASLKSILVTANSEFIGFKDDEPVPAQIHREQLKKLICMDADQNVPYENVAEYDDYEANNDQTDNDFHGWFDRILEDALRYCRVETDEDNFHYCPEINRYLKQLIGTPPLWSGIAAPIFKYGSQSHSSAIVESYFADLKTKTLKQENAPLRVDDFFVIHYRAIQSILMITRSIEDQTIHSVGKKEKIIMNTFMYKLNEDLFIQKGNNFIWNFMVLDNFQTTYLQMTRINMRILHLLSLCHFPGMNMPQRIWMNMKILHLLSLSHFPGMNMLQKIWMKTVI